jgi:hypothetical protein
MPENSENEVDIKYLLKYLNIDNDSYEPHKIKQSITHFDNFYKKVKEQPLSSFIKTIELKCRALSPIFDEFFNIDYVKYNEEIGSCKFFKNDKNKIDRFRISIPNFAKEPSEDCPFPEEPYERDYMAHELGHLYDTIYALEKKYSDVKEKSYRTENQEILCDFLINYLNNVNKTKDSDDKANIIASLILNKRVIFCKHKAPTIKALNRSYENIVKALKKLKK